MSFRFSLSRWFFNAFDEYRQEFYEDFASALRDGIAPPDRLKKLTTRARQRRSGFAPLYEHWLRKMRRMSFAHALQNTVPEYEVMVLTAAEEDGRLHEAMDYLSRSLRLSKKIKGIYFISLISPAIALLTLLGFFVTNAVLIGPQNLQVLPLEKWPEISRNMYLMSKWLVDGWIINLIALAALYWLVSWSKKNWLGKIRWYVDKVPFLPWRGHREREGNSFLISFAILLQSNNQGPKEAVERMRKFASPWMNWHLALMLKRLKLSPQFPARALNTGLFEVRVMDRIEDYSERTDFTKALQMLAFDQGDRQVMEAERRAVFGGFAAMLIVAAVVGLIAAAGYEFNAALESYIQTIK
ncbi:hypothetical protein ABRY74_22955 [Pseudomonas guariconensis]|uniref:hypothetical protein n=1 Tax=Pseudomonas guariconensis TaxID=1288410 RepID=UPI003EE30165